MAWLVRFSVDPGSGGADGSAAAELLGSRLWDLGTTGIAESGDGTLTAGFDSEEAARAAVAVLLSSPAGEPRPSPGTLSVEPAPPVAELMPDDGPHDVVVDAPGGAITMAIRAGGAFGHGAHPTTALALELLVEAVRSAGRAGPAVLDVGTGTGVLAIAASLAGAAAVDAIDTDERAVTVARANALTNGVQVRCSTDTVADLLAGRDGAGYEVVVANVLVPVHRELGRDLVAAVRPGGALITTGYLVAQAAEVLDGLRRIAVGDGPRRSLPVVERTLLRAGWSAHLVRLGDPGDAGSTGR